MNLHEKSVVSMHDESDSEMTLLEGDEDIDRASRSIKAMSHPLRLKILCTLGDQEVSVQDIVDQVGTSQSNISQHLAILRDKGILTSRKDANRVFYRVSDNRTLQADLHDARSVLHPRSLSGARRRKAGAGKIITADG